MPARSPPAPIGATRAESIDSLRKEPPDRGRGGDFLALQQAEQRKAGLRLRPRRIASSYDFLAAATCPTQSMQLPLAIGGLAQRSSVETPPARSVQLRDVLRQAQLAMLRRASTTPLDARDRRPDEQASPAATHTTPSMRMSTPVPHATRKGRDRKRSCCSRRCPPPSAKVLPQTPRPSPHPRAVVPRLAAPAAGARSPAPSRPSSPDRDPRIALRSPRFRPRRRTRRCSRGEMSVRTPRGLRDTHEQRSRRFARVGAVRVRTSLSLGPGRHGRDSRGRSTRCSVLPSRSHRRRYRRGRRARERGCTPRHCRACTPPGPAVRCRAPKGAVSGRCASATRTPGSRRSPRRPDGPATALTPPQRPLLCAQTRWWAVTAPFLRTSPRIRAI